MVRSAIAKVLYERTPEKVPDLYLKFARSLSKTDTVLTFNYDTLLERAMEEVGLPYRLFPDRYSDVDTWKDELEYFKLHGSIDWFDRAPYERLVRYAAESQSPWEVKHHVFGQDRLVKPIQITDGPRAADDRLQDLYRVRDLGPLMESDFWKCSPMLLSPSHSKTLYSEPLLDLWWGIQNLGGPNLGMGVIGYSLPIYDEYARQALYSLFRNYTELESLLELDGQKKTKLKLLDFQVDGDETNLRAAYRFVNWSRTELWLEGFNEDSIDWFFDT